MAVPYDFSKEVGRIFGDLSFIRFSHRQHYHPFVICLCRCGKETIVSWDNLKAGRTKSCGCKKGYQTNYTKHPLYKTWCSMKQRCNNPNNSKHPQYGARGVMVDPRWENDFPAFADWSEQNGWKRGLQLDKDIKAKELGVEALVYSPEMCQWVTPKVNMRTKRNIKLTEEKAEEIRKSDKTAVELSKIYGIHKNNVRAIQMGKQWK